MILFPLSSEATTSFASMSEKAFVFLEALDVLESLSVLSSYEYVVSEESVMRLKGQHTTIADQEDIPAFLLLAIHNPDFILTDRDDYHEVIIHKEIVDYKGEHPLDKLELILYFGELFYKEAEAMNIYTKSKNDYLKLISFVQSLEYNPIQVILFCDDQWLISFFRDANIDIELKNLQEGSEPFFLLNKEEELKRYTFSKRTNGYGYSDLYSSAILYPQYLLSDIISLLYLSLDDSTLTYIERVDEKWL
jgi:hypothetical protein